MMNFGDPIYKQVLGLAEDAPLENWFHLLGVSPHETDDKAFEQAMLARIGQVRRYQVGAYQAQALELINELSLAYVGLSSPASRQEYASSLGGAPAAAALHAAEVVEADVVEPAWPKKASRLPGRDQKSERLPRAKRLPDRPARLPKAEALPDEEAKPVCPQCGKPRSPKVQTCYHCGHRRDAAAARSGEKEGAVEMAPAFSASDLLRQDLTPEQLLLRLRRLRRQSEASKLSQAFWLRPTRDKQMGLRPSSHCTSCRRGLIYPSQAFGITTADLCTYHEHLSQVARKLESLGKHQFRWPLDDAQLRQVRAMIPNHESGTVQLLCQRCFERLMESPVLGDEVTR